jgi:hypothetical protein
MSQHKNVAKNGKSNLPLYNAINKYGWENIETIHIKDGLLKEDAVKLEIEVIESFNAIQDGYNASPGGSIPSIHSSNQMIQQHKNLEYHNKVITALHSNEEQRLASLRTTEYRKLVGDRNSKLIREGKSKLPILKKPVICNETKQLFPSITDAANFFKGIRTHLRAHLKGDKYRPRFKGLTFSYQEKENA